ncbi:MAG: hypothetical protein EOP34_08995 [Rickettsiales bacterium]|nr:MAG: hypothetical protein EOP34_08995 [Rickettsiales bacterium]
MASVKLFANKKHEIRFFQKLKEPFVLIDKQNGFYYMWLLYTGFGIFTSLYAIGSIAMLIIGFRKG